MSKKENKKVPYTDPVTGKTRMVSKVISANDHNLTGSVRGVMPTATKNKISEGVKASHIEDPKRHHEATKRGISAALTGRVDSDKTKRKKSEKAKAGWKKRKAASDGMSDETKKKISKGSKGKPKSAAHKAKISAAMKARAAKKKQAGNT